MSTPILKMSREEINALMKNETRMKALSELNRMKLNRRVANLNKNVSGLGKSAQTAVSSSVVTPSLQAAFAKTTYPNVKLGSNTRKFYEQGGKRKRKSRQTRRRR